MQLQMQQNLHLLRLLEVIALNKLQDIILEEQKTLMVLMFQPQEQMIISTPLLSMEMVRRLLHHLVVLL